MNAISPIERRPTSAATGAAPPNTTPDAAGSESRVRVKLTLGERIARLFGTTHPAGRMTFPVMLVESEREYVLRAECPNIRAADLKVRIDSNNVLTISGDHRNELVTHLHGQIFCDRTYAGFYHAISLPPQVDRSRIEASCRDGVLDVHIPKSEQVAQRAIEIAQ